MNTFFSSQPILLTQGIAIVRIIFGMLIIYHGIEVFDPTLIKSYVDNGMVSGSSALFMVYVGKLSELTCGILLLLGFMTRVGALIAIGTFSYITFVVGEGRFWYEEQHPFMFALFGLLFLFAGPGSWSLDAIVFNPRKKV
jgi:putative oxidoreductase